MYEYAFIGYLDHEAEVYFKNLWRDLSDKNITKYGIETKGKRPHITIANYERLDKERFIDLVDKIYDDKEKIDISLNMLGTFIDTGTLFIAPTLSIELSNLHRNHYGYFREFDNKKESLYIPGKWSPHCTIASRLSEENMVQAFKYCRNNINKISCKLSEIALVEIKLNADGSAEEDTIIYSKELK